MRMWERTLCACFIKENIAIRIFAYGHLSFTSQFIYACERASYSKKPLVDSSTLPYKKEVGLTDLVLPFYGEFHQQLLGIGADEDEWGGRLLTGIRELQGWGGGWGANEEKISLASCYTEAARPYCAQNGLALMMPSITVMNHSVSSADTSCDMSSMPDVMLHA